MPLDGLNINFPPSISIPVRRLQHTFTTFIRGLLNPAQALAEPFAYVEYIQKQKQQKIEAERASRITTKKKLPKVNRDLAKRLLENQETEGEAKTGDDVNMKKKSKKIKGLSSVLMEDERFTKMFENKISNYAVVWFILLFASIFTTGILQLRLSGLGIEDRWRNEQFWVIVGTSTHLFDVFQGLLKVLARIDTNLGPLRSMLSCNHCEARLGYFNWSGIQCISGSWITPGF